MSAPKVPTQGRLEDYPVNRLLEKMMDDGLSGCLTVSRGRISRKLYTNRGMITYAASNEKSDRLGEILIVQGTLVRNEVNRAFRKAKPLQARLGQTLLVDGKITSQELFQGVTAQVVGILERMRSWRKGDFEFEEFGAPPPGTVLLRIPLSLYLGKAEKQKKSKAGREKEKAPPEKAAAGAEAEEEDLDLTPEEIFVEEEEEEPPPPAAGEEEGEAEETGTVAAGEGERPEGEIGASLGEAVIPPDAVETAEEHEKLIEEITFNVQEVGLRADKDPFTLLGVNPSASAEEVQEAYHYLARLLHPDQHPPDLPEEVAGEAAELFKAVSAAYQEASSSVASPKPKPGHGMVVPPPGRISPPPPAGRMMEGPAEVVDEGDATRELYFRAKKYIAKGNYWQATDSLRQAVRRKPREAMYRNLLGYCLMQTGRRLHEAEEHIKTAIRLDPGNPDYVTSLGLVYKSGRFYKKAQDMFKQALIYDKHHELARRELRNLPREVESSNKSKTLWTKIFGK